MRAGLSVPKNIHGVNEDSFQHSDRTGVFSLSDGASISYDSASWSKILVRQYGKRPSVNRSWFDEAKEAFGKLHNRDSMPWMKQASFDRGSSATLLGIEHIRETNKVKVIAIGDTLAVLCDGSKIIKTWPYSDASQFSDSPNLISTNPVENTLFSGQDILQEFIIEWSLDGIDNPTLFCMTDALGLWLLEQSSNDPSIASTLHSLGKKVDFEKFVLEQRAAGLLKRDDTTLLTLTIHEAPNAIPTNC